MQKAIGSDNLDLSAAETMPCHGTQSYSRGLKKSHQLGPQHSGFSQIVMASSENVACSS